MKPNSAKIFISLLLCSFGVSALSARPLLTLEAPTMGKFMFEGGMAVSFRQDNFGFPKNTYETVLLPFHAAIGLHDRLDFGVELRHVSHRLDTPMHRFKGSDTGQFSMNAKFALSEAFSLFGRWELSSSEDEVQDLPVIRGNNAEAVLLWTLPTEWPISVNVGHIWRGPYNSDFGIKNGPVSQVEPGPIFESKAAMEIPLRFGLSLLTECAYYNIGKQKIAGNSVSHSTGEALDALVGLTWSLKGWDLGLGAGFGLLDESHSSFEIDKGAGDVTGYFSAAYRLKPHPPIQWDK